MHFRERQAIKWSLVTCNSGEYSVLCLSFSVLISFCFLAATFSLAETISSYLLIKCYHFKRPAQDGKKLKTLISTKRKSQGVKKSAIFSESAIWIAP